MPLKYLLLLSFLACCLSLNAQTGPRYTADTIGPLTLSADSAATVLGWFRKIEEGGTILSYNVSDIDLTEKIRIRKQSLSVGQLLDIVLHRYDYKADSQTSGKILIQVRGLRRFILKGCTRDEDSGEPLEGCTVLIRADGPTPYATLTDSSGRFVLLLPYGSYRLNTTYVGYEPYAADLHLDRESDMVIPMTRKAILLEEVRLMPASMTDTVGGKGISSLLSVNGADPFAPISTLPGVYGSPVSGNLHVNGGQNDENLILLDGVPIYHSHHNNTLLAQFNGEAIKRISFYDSFIPAQYEGRLSSVTDVRIREGDSISHHQTLGLDLPSASLAFEGPVAGGRISYLVSGRHSWMDFMKDLFSDQTDANRTFNDLTGKLMYRPCPSVSLECLAYRSRDRYNDSIDGRSGRKLLEWKNDLYSISCHALLPGGISSTGILSYSGYRNSIYAPVINIQSPVYISEGMRNLALRSGFSKKLDDYTDLSWGMSAAGERFNLLASKDTVENRIQKVVQASSYLNARIRLTDRVSGNAAVSFVTYLPEGHRCFFSIQPRFTVSYAPDGSNLFSIDFSRMEQFYHNICLGEIPLPTDLRIPSIDGFRPSSSLHCEMGWKHIAANWRTEISAYFKRRSDILGIRYDTEPEKEGWDRFIMKGDASSHGIKVHTAGQWNRWSVNLSYTCSKSREWFEDFDNSRKHPSLHDVPHLLNCAASYRAGHSGIIAIGGYIRSGMLENILGADLSSRELISGRMRRKPNYRLDLSFARSVFSRTKGPEFSYKIGLYNIIGNPRENEMIDLYSIKTEGHCLPYFTLRLRL